MSKDFFRISVRSFFNEAAGVDIHDRRGRQGWDVAYRSRSVIKEKRSREEIEAEEWLREQGYFEPQQRHVFLWELSVSVRAAVRAAIREARTFIALSGEPVGWQPNPLTGSAMQALLEWERCDVCVGVGRPRGAQSVTGRSVLRTDTGNIPMGRRTQILRKTRKVSEAQVTEMRTLYRTGGISQGALAKRYGITQPHVGTILSGVIYRDVPGPLYWPGVGFVDSPDDGRRKTIELYLSDAHGGDLGTSEPRG